MDIGEYDRVWFMTIKFPCLSKIMAHRKVLYTELFSSIRQGSVNDNIIPISNKNLTHY